MFSSSCRNRQPLAVAIQWPPRCGECRTRHSAKGYMIGVAASPRADDTELQRIVRILTLGFP